jgi:hypothetical protein
VAPTTKAATVRKRASELMALGKVETRLAELRAEVAREVQVDVADVVRVLKAVLETDLREVVEWSPDGLVLRASTELTPEAAIAVREVRESRTVSRTKDGEHVRELREVKLHDRVRAAELLGKYLAMFVDRQEVGHSGEVVIVRATPSIDSGP